MTSYANQRHITINKNQVNKNNPYMCVNIEDVELAARVLKPTTFKLWIYFAKNQDNYEFYLSPKALDEAMNVSDSQYRRAMSELIENGYLVETSSNHYTFYESPCGQSPIDLLSDTCQNDWYDDIF